MKSQIMNNYKLTAKKEHTRILQRRITIEQRKEQLETLNDQRVSASELLSVQIGLITHTVTDVCLCILATWATVKTKQILLGQGNYLKCKSIWAAEISKMLFAILLLHSQKC